MKKYLERDGWKPSIIFLCFFLLFLIVTLSKTTEKSTPFATGQAIVGTRATITGLEINHTCTIPLAEHLNLISLSCSNTTNSSIANRVEHLGTNLQSVHRYDPTNETDPWKAYAPNLPDYVIVDLQDHDPNVGYWISVKDDTTLNSTGYFSLPNFVTYSEGEQLVGFPSNQSEDILTALSSSNGTFRRILTLNRTAGGQHVYIVNSSENNLTEFNPTQGYWLNATDSGFIKII